MAIKIYWGPPGSYKTSSAVAEEVLKCYHDGRVLVTNIRGLTEEGLREHCPGKAGEGFKVISLKQNDPADVDKMRRWWHWVPFGAYIIFDEVQAIYPPDWTRKDLHDLDMPELQQRQFPSGEDMPRDVSLIFDMHRHGNWDMAFTTPSIKKVRPEIRAAAECAYKHKNLAILGIRGRFMQFMHLAEDNGNNGDIYGARSKKIPKWVFNAYRSTATGAVRDSGAGFNLFSDPRVIFLAGMVLFSIGWLLYRGLPAAFGGKSDPAPVPVQADPARPGVHPVAQGLRHVGRAIEPGYSASWRLVAVTDLGDGNRVAYVASGRRVRRIHGDSCQLQPLGWECQTEDGLATVWTGPEPEADQYHRPKETVASAASAG